MYWKASVHVFKNALLHLGTERSVPIAFQDRVYDEQVEIFGDEIDADVCQDDLQKMKVTEAVVKEALRLYHSVPLIGRLIFDSFLEYDNYKTKPGHFQRQEVFLPLWHSNFEQS